MRVLLSIFGLIVFPLCFSQEIKLSDDFHYTHSQPYKVLDGRKSYFSKGKQVLTVKYDRGKFNIQRFAGKNMDEIVRNQFEAGESFTHENHLEFNGRYFLFFSKWDRDNEIEKLFVREIDFENAAFIDEGKLLIQVRGRVAGKFEFTTSYSEDKLLIRFRMKPNEKRDAFNKDIIGMHVFDENLNRLWSSLVEMPYTEEKMNNLGYSIDVNGNAFVLTEVYNDETRKKKTSSGDPNIHFEIIRVDSKDQSTLSSTFNLKDKFITDVDFFEGKENKIIVAGYYGNFFDHGTDGVFMATLDEDGGLEDIVSYEIPVSVMSKYMSEWKQDRMAEKDLDYDIAMPDMVLREITFHPNGSITLYGERYYTRTTYGSGPAPAGIPTTQTTSYYYEDILVTHIKEDGSIGWMDKLPKRQKGSVIGPVALNYYTRFQGGMGYFVMSSDQYDYILFLDNVKNIELPIDKYPKTHLDGKGGYLTGFKIQNETGNIEKLSILNTEDVDGVKIYQFKTDRIIQLDDNSFAFECYIKRKEDIMIKVELVK